MQGLAGDGAREDACGGGASSWPTSGSGVDSSGTVASAVAAAGPVRAHVSMRRLQLARPRRPAHIRVAPADVPRCWDATPDVCLRTIELLSSCSLPLAPARSPQLAPVGRARAQRRAALACRALGQSKAHPTSPQCGSLMADHQASVTDCRSRVGSLVRTQGTRHRSAPGALEPRRPVSPASRRPHHAATSHAEL